MIASLRATFARRLAASHLAGPALEDALRIAGVVAARGWSCAIGPWVGPDGNPESNAGLYARTIDAIASGRPDAYLSIKLSTLGYDNDRFFALLERAARSGTRVHADSLGPETADRTMAMIAAAAARFTNVGTTLPAGWRRSVADAAALSRLGVNVRIVKGQWPDPAGRIPDIRSAFVRVAEALAGGAGTVGVATHDRPLAVRVLGLLASSGTPCEMEQISGLPWNCAATAASAGVPFRLYVPFGHPYLPYGLRTVRVRPAVALWAARDFIAGRHRRVR